MTTDESLAPPAARRSLYQPLRTLLVSIHVLASVSWLSQAIGIATLVGASLAASSPGRRLAFAEAAELVDATVLVFSANAAAGTGFLLAAMTTWGYFRHWWVAAKLVMTFGQLYAGIFVLSLSMPDVVAAAAEGRDGPAGTVAVGAVLMASGLAVQVWLSVAKPFGTTPLARRSRVRTQTAPTWLMVMAVAAVVLDVPFGVLVGDPFPLLALLTLVTALVVRGRGFRAQRRAARVADGATAELVATTEIAPAVHLLRVRPSGGTTPWAPGAHVDVVLPSGLVRQYSLCGDPEDRDAYEIAVLADPDGRGGSVELGALPPGTPLGVDGPRNHFPLVEADRVLMVAGGIGVTPFVPMAAELHRRGIPFTLVYRGASRASMAFADDLLDRYGADRVVLRPADEHPRPVLRDLLAAQPAGTAVYCCGPTTMLDDFETTAMALGLTPHLERFDPVDTSDLPSEPFEAVLAWSRRRVEVPAGVSMLDALRPSLPDLPASCETGVCGTCVLPVLAGRPDHRDGILAGAERDRGDVIYPCVSRCAERRIVLDA